MIGLLRGTVTTCDPTSIILLVGGVGYHVAVTTPTRYQEGDTVTLHTYLAVRETALDLYGFPSAIDKRVFELLLTVPKIGPKSALQVLTQADTTLLLECISTDDASRLHKLAGVGKKTSENIVAHLRDKVADLAPATTPTDSNLTQNQQDAIDALISLGYDPKVAREQIRSADGAASVSELVAQALQ